MTIQELVTSFGFEVDQKPLEELEAGIGAIKKGITGLAASVGTAAVGLFALVKTTANSGDRFAKMSQSVGITVERLQELDLMARLGGASFEEMTQSLTFVSRNMEKAAKGSKTMQAAFREAGITLAEIRSGTVGSDQALERIGRTFSRMPDGPKKTALAMELFGRSGARMIPMLNAMGNGLTETQRKILEMNTITEEQARASEVFNDAMTVMLDGIRGVGRQIAVGLLPVATEIVETITQWVVANKELLLQNIGGFVNGLTRFLRSALRYITLVVEALSGLMRAFGGAESATWLFLTAIASLSGLMVLAGIGKLIMGLRGLATAITLVNAKALLIPTLIGAAFVAILILIEDIYSFMVGKNSVIGKILDVIPEIGIAFKNVFGPVGESLFALIYGLTEGTMGWKDALLGVGELILNVILFPLRAVASALGGIAGLAGRLTGIDFLKDVGGFANSAAERLKFHRETGSVTGITPTTSGVGSSTVNNGGNEINATMQFNFPPGTDPIAAGSKISSDVNEGLEALLRRSSRATANGGPY